jgi:hypothetical protein
MSIAGLIVALCTLTSEPSSAEASAGGAGHRETTPVRRPAAKPIARPAPRHEVRPAIAPASVVGRVVDALGNAVADVTVVATPGYIGAATPVRPAPRARTDRDGRFRFVGLPPGEYVFVAIHREYAPGVSPTMPVDQRGGHGLEVVLIVGGALLTA